MDESVTLEFVASFICWAVATADRIPLINCHGAQNDNPFAAASTNIWIIPPVRDPT